MQLTSKGQVTIPKKYRDKFGLRAGVDVDFIEDRGSLKLVKSLRKRGLLDEVYGVLQQRDQSTDKLIEDLRGR